MFLLLIFSRLSTKPLPAASVQLKVYPPAYLVSFFRQEDQGFFLVRGLQGISPGMITLKDCMREGVGFK